MKEITIKLYTFDELSDEAKKRAHKTFLSTGDLCSLLRLAGCHSTHKAAVISIVHYCINNGIIKKEEING